MSDAPETSANLLSFKGVSKFYPGTRALEDIDLTLNAGDAVAIIGANGAGKSTLVKILAGEFDDYSGQVLVGDAPVSLTSPKAAIRNRIAVVQQAPDVVGSLSALANVFLGLEPQAINIWPPRLNEQRELFTRVVADLGLDLDPTQRAADLNVDELQVVRIVRALVRNPTVLVLDEATTGLRPSQAEALKTRLMAHCGRGGALLFVTHNLKDALTWCRRVVVLRDGRLVFNIATDSTTPAELEMQMFGEQSGETFGQSPQAVPHPKVELVDISTGSLERISISVGAGERVGIVCANRKSREDLAHCLVGATRLGSGLVRIDGQVVSLSNPAVGSRSGIAFVPGNRVRDALFPLMAAADNIALGILDRLRSGGLLGRRKVLQVANEAAARFGIRGRIDQPIIAMSGGNQQKCVVARSVLSAPKLLLLEEPFTGVDISSRIQVCRVLDDLRSTGMATLVFSDSPDDLWQLSDRFVVIADARVKRVCSHSDTTREDIAHELSGLGSVH